MAQKADPKKSNLTALNDQKGATTGHRGIEQARQLAAQKGKHPEKGQFQSSTDVKTGNKTHTAPSGASVTVKSSDTSSNAKQTKPDTSTPPMDRPVTLSDENGTGHTMSQPAADVYLKDRYGISGSSDFYS
jgi:hypothetical protein